MYYLTRVAEMLNGINKTMASIEYQQRSTESNTRKWAGTALEYGGAIFGLIELFGFEFGAAFVGGLIWLAGRWIRYAGQESRSG